MRPRPFPLQQELTGLPRDDGAACGLVPPSGSIQVKGLVPALHILWPLPTGRPGTGLCQARSYLPPFHRPTVLSPRDEPLETRLCRGSREEGKEA